jgi:Domain of unknown function (DUF4397)
MRFRREFLAGVGALAAACASLALAGCGTGSSSASQSLIKSINTYVPASGADGSLTLFANTIYLTGGNIGFGTVANSGGYVSLTSGNYNLTASGPNTSPIVLNNQSFNGNNTAYTILATGEAGQTGTYAPKILVLPNYVNGQLVLPAGTAAVRVVNLSLNANNVGLFKTSASVPTAAVAANFASLAYGYSAANNVYAAVATSSLTNMAVVDVTAPTTPLALQTTTNLNTQSFVAGDAYTLYIYGQPGNTSQPLSATWVQDYPAP